MDDSSFEEDFSEAALFSDNDDEPMEKPAQKEENPFEIYSSENIMQDAYDIAYRVQAFLALPITMVAIRELLTYYKWDDQRLISEYFEYENNAAAFFEQAKVANPFNEPPSIPSTDATHCMICYSDIAPDSLYSLDCGHKYCRQCWNQYITTKIVEDAANQRISCLQPNCETLVDDENVLILIDDPEIIQKYRQSMTNSFVQNNKAINWCPAPGCSYAAKKKKPSAKNLCACKCGHEFCFECRDYWHEPVTCTRLKQWKNSSDSETLQWIVEHAKPCPSCEANIEKNGGCNHITCRNCKHEFCWVCMGEWRQHRACNRFDESSFIGQRELARFKHFQDRYGNQLESLRLETISYRNIETKVEELKEECSMTNNEIRFLRDAVKVLIRSRRTLTYTFVFAYFLQKNNHVEIFEDNQSDLESAVERLSGFLEAEITNENVVELKKNIQDSYKYCEQRCNVLMEHIREGEEKSLWQMH